MKQMKRQIQYYLVFERNVLKSTDGTVLTSIQSERKQLKFNLGNS